MVSRLVLQFKVVHPEHDSNESRRVLTSEEMAEENDVCENRDELLGRCLEDRCKHRKDGKAKNKEDRSTTDSG